MHLAIMIPMITVPLTLLAMYGVIWPDPVIGSASSPEATEEQSLTIVAKHRGFSSYSSPKPVEFTRGG